MASLLLSLFNDVLNLLAIFLCLTHINDHFFAGILVLAKMELGNVQAKGSGSIKQFTRLLSIEDVVTVAMEENVLELAEGAEGDLRKEDDRGGEVAAAGKIIENVQIGRAHV